MNISPVTRSFQTVAVDKFKTHISHKNVERFLTRLLGLFLTLTGPLKHSSPLVEFINMNNVDGHAKPWRSNEYNRDERMNNVSCAKRFSPC